MPASRPKTGHRRAHPASTQDTLDQTENSLTGVHVNATNISLFIGLSETVKEARSLISVLQCPLHYPMRPPRVRLLNTEDGRLNPNFFESGKPCVVVLSIPDSSTRSLAQSIKCVLVAINSLGDSVSADGANVVPHFLVLIYDVRCTTAVRGNATEKCYASAKRATSFERNLYIYVTSCQYDQFLDDKIEFLVAPLMDATVDRKDTDDAMEFPPAEDITKWPQHRARNSEMNNLPDCVIEYRNTVDFMLEGASSQCW
ncbi:hypothetical protein MRX96_023720 [Rhipicephalus microplus]